MYNDLDRLCMFYGFGVHKFTVNDSGYEIELYNHINALRKSYYYNTKIVSGRASIRRTYYDFSSPVDYIHRDVFCISLFNPNEPIKFNFTTSEMLKLSKLIQHVELYIKERILCGKTI